MKVGKMMKYSGKKVTKAFVTAILFITQSPEGVINRVWAMPDEGLVSSSSSISETSEPRRDQIGSDNQLTREDVVARAVLPTADDKQVWTFWHAGYDEMPAFNQLNIEGWKRVLGPKWKIHVVNVVPGDPDHLLNYVERESLPRSFDALSKVVKSDSARLALLARYGGVWMDSSIILVRSLDEICWNEMSSSEPSIIQAGYFSASRSNDHLDRKDYFENWFIASRRNNPFIGSWKHTFNTYWDDRTESKEIWKHPLYAELDLSNFTRFNSDFRNYLTQHVAFRRVIEVDSVMRDVWRTHMKRMPDDKAFALTKQVGWKTKNIDQKLLNEKDERLSTTLLSSDLIKFTSSMLDGIRKKTKHQLMTDDNTLGTIYRALIERVN